MTGDVLSPVFRADKIEQMTLIARVSAIWITIVNAGQRILKCRFALPWRTNRSSVASLLDEVQFIFEDFENIALIRCHGGKPPFHSVVTNWLAFRQLRRLQFPLRVSARHMPFGFVGDRD